MCRGVCACLIDEMSQNIRSDLILCHRATVGWQHVSWHWRALMCSGVWRCMTHHILKTCFFFFLSISEGLLQAEQILLCFQDRKQNPLFYCDYEIIYQEQQEHRGGLSLESSLSLNLGFGWNPHDRVRGCLCAKLWVCLGWKSGLFHVFIGLLYSHMYDSTFFMSWGWWNGEQRLDGMNKVII